MGHIYLPKNVVARVKPIPVEMQQRIIADIYSTSADSAGSHVSRAGRSVRSGHIGVAEDEMALAQSLVVFKNEFWGSHLDVKPKYLQYNSKDTEELISILLMANRGVMPLMGLAALAQGLFGWLPFCLTDKPPATLTQPFKNVVYGGFVYFGRYWRTLTLENMYVDAIRDGNLKMCRIGNNRVHFAVVRQSDVLDSFEKQSELHKFFSANLGFSILRRKWWLRPMSQQLQKGGYCIFVSDRIPREFWGEVVMHEFVELASKSHDLATEKEFAAAANKGRNFLRRYTSYWISLYGKTLKKLLQDARQRRILRTLLPEMSVRMLESAGYL